MSLPYLQPGDREVTAAEMNKLFLEFDGKLSLLLGKKTPFLTGGLGAELTGHLFLFPSPDRPAGHAAMTNPYTANASPPAAYDHSVFTTVADGLAFGPVDDAKGIMQVTAVGPNFFADSLEAHQRGVHQSDGSTRYYYLWPADAAEPEKRHKFAVAELLFDGWGLTPGETFGGGPPVFTFKKEWTKYNCFRLHNLSGGVLNVEFEGPAGGVEHTVGLTPYACQTVRREPVPGGPTHVYDGQLMTYFWQYHIGDPRFYHWRVQPYGPPGTGAFRPGWWAQCNNVVNPRVVYDWIAAFTRPVGGSPPRTTGYFIRDPQEIYTPPVQTGVGGKPAPYGNPATAGTKFGDLIWHAGRVVVAAVDTAHGNATTFTEALYHRWDDLVTNLAAAGVKVTTDATNVTFAPADGTDPAILVDLITFGTNFLIDGHPTRMAVNINGGFTIPLLVETKVFGRGSVTDTTAAADTSYNEPEEPPGPQVAVPAYDVTEATTVSGHTHAWSVAAGSPTQSVDFHLNDLVSGLPPSYTNGNYAIENVSLVFTGFGPALLWTETAKHVEGNLSFPDESWTAQPDDGSPSAAWFFRKRIYFFTGHGWPRVDYEAGGDAGADLAFLSCRQDRQYHRVRLDDLDHELANLTHVQANAGGQDLSVVRETPVGIAVKGAGVFKANLQETLSARIDLTLWDGWFPAPDLLHLVPLSAEWGTGRSTFLNAYSPSYPPPEPPPPDTVYADPTLGVRMLLCVESWNLMAWQINTLKAGVPLTLLGVVFPFRDPTTLDLRSITIGYDVGQGQFTPSFLSSPAVPRNMFMAWTATSSVLNSGADLNTWLGFWSLVASTRADYPASFQALASAQQTQRTITAAITTHYGSPRDDTIAWPISAPTGTMDVRYFNQTYSWSGVEGYSDTDVGDDTDAQGAYASLVDIKWLSLEQIRQVAERFGFNWMYMRLCTPAALVQPRMLAAGTLDYHSYNAYTEKVNPPGLGLWGHYQDTGGGGDQWFWYSNGTAGEGDVPSPNGDPNYNGGPPGATSKTRPFEVRETTVWKLLPALSGDDFEYVFLDGGAGLAPGQLSFTDDADYFYQGVIMNQPGASPGSITSSFVWDQVVVYAPAPGGGASAADIKAYAYAQLQYGRTSPLGFLKVTSFDEDPAHPIANVKTWLFFSPLGFLLHTKDYWAGATDARTVFEGGGGGGGGDVSDSSLGGTIVFTEVIPIETGPLSLPDIPHTFVDSGTSGADGNHARARLLTDDYSWIGPDMQLEQGGSGGSYEVWAMKGWIEFL